MSLVRDPKNLTVFSGGSLVYSSRTDAVFYVYANLGDGSASGNITYIKSTDDGHTWGKPVVLPYLSSGFVSHGIETQNGPLRGRLIVLREIFFGRKNPNDPNTPGGFENKVSAIYSDDAGETWHAGAFLPPPWREGEPSIAELHNGSLVITARNGQNRSSSNMCEGEEICRVFSRSDSGWYSHTMRSRF